MFLYALILVVSLVRVCLPHLKPGVYKMSSPDHFKLYLHMGLCNYVFTTSLIHHIQLMSLTRWLFYRGVGLKLDRSVMIAPGALIRDTNVVSIGKRSLIGGHAFIVGHVAVSLEEFIVGNVEIGEDVIIGGCASLSPGNKIGSGALIGPFAILLPMVQVGESSRVLPNSVVTAGTVIPPNEMWGGTPARKIRDLSPEDLRKIEA
jgi:carbonic anhydrase/acetyltransferase-like protein (isoleucine patch superfamily)